MKDTFSCRMMTCEGLVFSGEALSIELPERDGDSEVLLNHCPYYAVLRRGVVEILTENEKALTFFVSGGVVMMDGRECSVVSEHVLLLKDSREDTIADALERLGDRVSNLFSE